MSQVASRLGDLESGNGSGNAHFDRPRLSFQTPRGGLHYRDSSGQLFSMYSKFAEEEDNKMTERWQKDADVILIFVSPCVRIYTRIGIKWPLPCHILWKATSRRVPSCLARKQTLVKVRLRSIPSPGLSLRSSSLGPRRHLSCFHPFSAIRLPQSPFHP
ncbi:hypothetical protein DFH94DRAFT_200560 [Russula ochroleuca]|uniref:Uncharacterized protein n=1 Tax=Russula ochroleuca TaxID=152965 RepID=A0A9P5JZP9_9AGAM|nr:hypothetical protein DFH94DRAFT_200560 [Russula ochroleuca]